MILFTAGRFRVCCSRSNTAGDRNKQSPTRKALARAGGRTTSCCISTSPLCTRATSTAQMGCGSGAVGWGEEWPSRGAALPWPAQQGFGGIKNRGLGNRDFVARLFLPPGAAERPPMLCHPLLGPSSAGMEVMPAPQGHAPALHQLLSKEEKTEIFCLLLARDSAKLRLPVSRFLPQHLRRQSAAGQFSPEMTSPPWPCFKKEKTVF